MIAGAQLLVAGSPIHAWRPSEAMLAFLNKLHPGQLDHLSAASFDTRVKLFIHGNAAKKISGKLEAAGARIIVQPQGFTVGGKEGPLVKGELGKARNWAERIKTALRSS